jgi:hypothetical protein
MAKISKTYIHKLIDCNDLERFIIEASKDDFDPHVIIRNKSLLDLSVFYNNIDIFKIIINHPKFDINKIKKKYTYYIERILEKLTFVDNFKNRQYLEEIKKNNILLSCHHIIKVESNNDLCEEIFPLINKNSFNDLNLIISSSTNYRLIELCFGYIKQHYENEINNQFIIGLISSAYGRDNLNLLKLLENKGYDIYYYDGKTGIHCCFSRMFSRNTSCDILDYLLTKDIKYNTDMYQDFISIFNHNQSFSYYYSNKVLKKFVYLLEYLKDKYSSANNSINFIQKLIDNLIFKYKKKPYNHAIDNIFGIYPNNYNNFYYILHILELFKTFRQLSSNKDNVFELFDDNYLQFIEDKITNFVEPNEHEYFYNNKQGIKQIINKVVLFLVGANYKLTDNWKKLLIKHKIFTEDEINNQLINNNNVLPTLKIKKKKEIKIVNKNITL